VQQKQGKMREMPSKMRGNQRESGENCKKTQGKIQKKYLREGTMDFVHVAQLAGRHKRRKSAEKTNSAVCR